MSRRSCHAGQAMIETVVAVAITVSVFFCLFRLSQMLLTKTLLEHAAMRVARARAMGFNDFICQKVARVAVIPVAGKRVWPTGEDAIGASEELARVAIYMQTPDAATANGVLEYARWPVLKVEPGDGTDVRTSLTFDGFTLEGEAGIEPNYTYYMTEQGL